MDKLVLERTKDLEKSNERIEQQRLKLEKANQSLRNLSFKDQLTGVWNRRKYDQIVEMEWNRCLRHKRPIALLIVDMDYFKEFNDSYGHMAGDACLVKIGEILKDSFRRSSDMVARYGGDEFVAILPETGKEEAMEMADMLRQKIEALHVPHAHSKASDYMTVTIGVTCLIPDKNLFYESLFRFADKALYEAKIDGRNQVKFLSEITQ